MADSACRRGAEVTSANFAWPSLRIQGTDPLQSDAAENGDAHAPEIREVDSTAENGFYSEEPRAENGHEIERLAKQEEDGESVMQVECRGLDHTDALGLIAIGNRLRLICEGVLPPAVVPVVDVERQHHDGGAVVPGVLRQPRRHGVRLGRRPAPLRRE